MYVCTCKYEEMYMNMYVHTLGVHHLIMYHGILTTSFILHPIKRCKLYSNCFPFLTFLCLNLMDKHNLPTYVLSHPPIHTYVVHGIHMHTHSSIAVQRHWALLSHPTFLSFNLTNHWHVPRATEVAQLPLLSVHGRWYRCVVSALGLWTLPFSL